MNLVVGTTKFSLVFALVIGEVRRSRNRGKYQVEVTSLKDVERRRQKNRGVVHHIARNTAYKVLVDQLPREVRVCATRW